MRTRRSGEAYAAEGRARVLKNTVLVTLDAAGGFSTPQKQAGEEVRGKWSCDGPEAAGGVPRRGRPSPTSELAPTSESRT